MTQLTYSETVYLFADKFVSQRAKVFNLEHHPSGEKIPVKVLGDLMVTSAVLYLEKNGYIKTYIKDVKKLLVFSGKDIFASKLKETDANLTGIESLLLSNISGETKLRKAVYNLLNSNDTLPWSPIINVSKQSLVKKDFIIANSEKKLLGYVTKYALNSEKLGEVSINMTEVQAELNAFTSNEKYNMTVTAVKKGISARVEHESADD